MTKKRKATGDYRIFIRRHDSAEIVELMKGRRLRHPRWVYTQTGLNNEQALQAVLAAVDYHEVVTTETMTPDLFCGMGIMVTGTPEVFCDDEASY